MRVAPFRLSRVGAISTLLPGLKASDSHQDLACLGGSPGARPERELIARRTRTRMRLPRLPQAIQRAQDACDLVVIFGASAITDRRDIIPAAIEAAGGRIEHFGMPVDPGNLLLIGRTSEFSGAKPLIGAPGCARSPKENGFDFILERMLANIPVTADDIREWESEAC